uniref:Uncharacterized protein n=1 Tax=Candidozyma auris TaxID=498019 RepID=A0A0L0NUN8_CANAR
MVGEKKGKRLCLFKRTHTRDFFFFFFFFFSILRPVLKCAASKGQRRPWIQTNVKIQSRLIFWLMWTKWIRKSSRA